MIAAMEAARAHSDLPTEPVPERIRALPPFLPGRFPRHAGNRCRSPRRRFQATLGAYDRRPRAIFRARRHPRGAEFGLPRVAAYCRERRYECGRSMNNGLKVAAPSARRRRRQACRAKRPLDALLEPGAAELSHLGAGREARASWVCQIASVHVHSFRLSLASGRIRYGTLAGKKPSL